MNDLSRKYLLLQDRVGANLERSLLSLGLSTKQVPTQVLRGELLEALHEAEQPLDSSKIALGGVERKSLRLECALDCIMRLAEEEANLLLAISSLEERVQTYMDSSRLEFGKNIAIGSRVFVAVKGFSKKLPGVVWYKGELSGCNGTMFGVELIEHQGHGTSDGMFGNQWYFTCAPDSGVFVGLDKLTPRDDCDPKYQKKGESVNIASRIKDTIIPSFLKGKKEPDLSQDVMKDRFSIGDRVVTFVKGDCPVRGTVRYIGNHKDRRGQVQTMLGLELDTADGEGTGKLHQKQLFVCRRNFAIFVPIVGVIREEEFDGNSVKASTGRIQKGCDNGKEVPSKSRSRAVESSGEGTTSNPVRERRQTLPSLQEQSLKERERKANVIGQAEEQKDSLQRKLMRSKEELENCQQQLRNKEEQLRGKEQEQDNLQRQLTEMVQRLANSQEQLQEREAGLENSQRQMREMEQRLTNCLELFHEREAGLLEQLRENEQQQEISQRRVREIEQRLTNCQEQLQEREARLQNSQRQVREMEQRLVNFERHVTENEAGRANLERQLVVKDQEMNELETSLSAAQQTISELRRRETCDWVIARDEIQMKEKCLGKGGWGSVNEGTYCGCVVAVKQIHELILSPHNRRLFEREMNIASRCRHPCLLQFIGATNDEGSPLFVTELMETSLRALLEQRELSEAEICVISLDVARALNYLHQRRPSPILHRDVSSANVLLWRRGDQWRGKVSDYGTAKFVQQTMTVAPGALIYSSPEALSSNQTAMVDVYSFGVLLCEMCIRELPDPERRDEQVVLVSNRVFRGLVRRCLETDPLMRPDMAQIIQELEQLNDTRS